MKKTLFLLLSVLFAATVARANDGVYFTSGNFLIPAQETDISAVREVLTITIGKDSFATVDVQYEFYNAGEVKTVKMAFEAMAQYNDNTPLHLGGPHPHIQAFTVSMNGRSLPYANAAVAFNRTSTAVSVPLDLRKWKGVEDVPDSILPASDCLYNADLDSIVPFAYAYYFDAPFVKGRNTVHHTYRYRMSFSVAEAFDIPYWLTPVTRWANGQADDFTLHITADDMAEFCLVDSVFSGAPFTTTGSYPIYQLKDECGTPFIFTTVMAGDTVTWHGKNFRPQADMNITSPSWAADSPMHRYMMSGRVIIDADGNEYRYLADAGDSWFVEVQDYTTVSKKGSRVEERDAHDGQGYLTVSDLVTGRVNVRQKPSTASPVVTTICYPEGMVPDVYPCLGSIFASDGYMWFKIRVGRKTGYVRRNLVVWDAIDSY